MQQKKAKEIYFSLRERVASLWTQSDLIPSVDTLRARRDHGESLLESYPSFDAAIFRALFGADGRRFSTTIIIQGLSGPPKMADGRRWARNAHWVGQIL